MKEKPVRININSIKDPNFVKTLSYRQLEMLCEDIRHEIILKTSLYGGHLSSNLGIVELTVALCRSFSFDKDKVIFDVGHQSYPYKILTGRSLDHLNEAGHISGFQKMNESPYDYYEAGHSSTSLSAIEGFAIARDLKYENYDIVSVIGDASIVNGLAFEALNDIGSRKHKVIVVLNDNEMSISSPTGSLGKLFRKVSVNKLYNDIKRSYRKSMVSKTGMGKRLGSVAYFVKSKIKSILVPNTIFDNMGFTYLGPVDGHNIKALERAFKEAKTATKSVLIHVRTQKGKGYGPAEKDKVGYWHGVTPFDIATGKPLHQHEGLNTWSHHVGDLVHQYMAKRADAELVVPAMVRGSGLEACFDDFPLRSCDVGIAEEHAVTMAGAMSLAGLHPIVTIYSTFLQRAYDELSHDCARMKTDMTLLIDRAGLVGKNGETHQGIYDVSFLKGIPNVTISMPSTYASLLALLDESMEKGRGVYAIRYPHEIMRKEEKEAVEPPLRYGKWIRRKEIVEGGVNVVAVGPLGHELYTKAKNMGIGFIDPLFLVPLDEETIDELMKSECIVIYDPYSTRAGFAETLLAKLMEKGYKGKTIIRALPISFIPHASNKEQLEGSSLLIEQMLELLSNLKGEI